MLLSIDSPFRKLCFSVKFANTYSLDSLPPSSRRTPQIQASPQSYAAACRVQQHRRAKPFSAFFKPSLRLSFCCTFLRLPLGVGVEPAGCNAEQGVKERKEHRHPADDAIKAEVGLAQRRQHPTADEQSTHQRIQASPVRGNDVQENSTVRGHKSLLLEHNALSSITLPNRDALALSQNFS